MLSAKSWNLQRAAARSHVTHRSIGALAALTLVALLTGLYALVMWHVLPATQTDVGADYAYTAWQMSQGARLYHDILGQQTPLLYLLGAAAYRLWPRPDTFLVLALALRSCTVLGIFALARACRLSLSFSAAACAVYLLLPMGFFFGAHFEPNVLITLGGVLCTLTLTQLSSRRAAFAGIACAAFILAKLTFIPLACALAIYLLITRRSLLYPFVLALFGALAAAIALGYWLVGPDFIRGAVLAHVGSTLSLSNAAVSLRYLWTVEGITILAAIAGGALSVRGNVSVRLIAFYLIGSAATVVATFSIGSLAPETLMAEPAIALCATLALRRIVCAWRDRAGSGRVAYRLLPLLVALLVVGQVQEARDNWLTAGASPSSGLSCTVTALTHGATARTPVIAPAYAAFLAQRPLVEGISDFFNWSIRVRRGDAVALAQARTVAQMLQQRRIPLVIVTPDLPLPPKDQRALSAAYVPMMRCASAIVFAPRA